MNRLKNKLTASMIDIIADAFEEKMGGYTFNYTVEEITYSNNNHHIMLTVYRHSHCDSLIRSIAISNEMLELMKSDYKMLSRIGYDFASDIKHKLEEAVRA